MAEKRSRKVPQVPFADAGDVMTEAALAPAKSAGLVPIPGEASPLTSEISQTVAAALVAAEVAEAEPVDANPAPAAIPAPAEAVPAPETAGPAYTTNFATPPSWAAPFLKGLTHMATAPETTYAQTERFQAMFGDMNERAKSAVEKSTKIAEELTELTKGNVEAFVASGRVAAKGAEALTQDAAEFGKKSFESATGALKSFAAVKSPTELFQLQSDYAKSSFDTAVAEASKFSESMLKLMGEIVQPLSTRYAVAAEKFKTASF